MRSIPRIFIGYDKRIPLAYSVLHHSIAKNASGMVSITPLILDKLNGFDRTGLTQFTFSRYLPPFLCDFSGKSLFLDSDMLVMGDVYELFNMEDDGKSVRVVKSGYRFEWPSVMLFNNERCHRLTPAYLSNEEVKPQRFEWAENGVGELPPEWNHLVGYDEPKPDAKLIHYTMGVPGFPECRNHEHSSTWRRERDRMEKIPSWIELMGTSVHRDRVLNGLKIGVTE